ncbi:putative receptor-like protein kinase [Nymphaea thermarum]|nr:putative receptor-like protein kinase [Nymphaea thermarum]
MRSLGLVSVAILFFILITSGEAKINPVLIACGRNSSVTAAGKTWISDSSTQNFTVSSQGIAASTLALSENSSYIDLYRTARIFTVPANYTMNVVAGSYFLRLHFAPFTFLNFSANESSFEVTANNVKLVSRFSPSGELNRRNSYLQNEGKGSNVTYLVKEYVLTVESSELSVAFVPASGSFVFVNAIEVISVMTDLFNQSATEVASGTTKNSLSELNGFNLETMYRLNVGGPEIPPSQDADLMRDWKTDSDWMFLANAASPVFNSSNISYSNPNNSFIAPLLVYESARTMSNNEVALKRFNMSWKFLVDTDFDYLIRLHFCEFNYNMARQRIFRIYINNRTASNNFDVIARAGGDNKAYHEDYLDSLSSQTNTIWVQLGPETAAGALVTDAILNGLEIFKISRNGNLARPIEKSGATAEDLENKSSKSKILWAATGSGIAAITILSAFSSMFFCVYYRRKADPVKDPSPNWRPLVHYNPISSIMDVKQPRILANPNGSNSLSRLGKRFSILEIRTATQNFDESLVIGVGGFGKVYKGKIDSGAPVAIKRANSHSEQGLNEFETEIDMLSKLRHRHLVAIIGFCDEHDEMILVYEYMANGTLRNHLFGGDLPALSWKQRIDICIGAARGLHYLHTGLERSIIHRDVKTTNILLDENFEAKVADFGLSKTGPSLEHTHVSTAVKGSFGYLDPEYYRRQHLTEKSDVYSFGVVLFEVVCARPVINPTLPKEQINLAEWAIHCQRQGLLEQIVDPRLKGKFRPESLKKYAEIAEKCLADEGKKRPTMGEVLCSLENVLLLERVAEVDMDPTVPAEAHGKVDEAENED